MTPTEAVRRALQERGLTKARLLCAVSGGADSMALLKALADLRSEMGFWLEALHVQHGLRGESSREDEAFVREWCSRWHTPLTVENARLDGAMEDPGMETRARDRRRQLFAKVMTEHAMDALLTAHHRDDQAETVLMHLCRGAGMEGLTGIRPWTPFGGGVLLRPFLAMSKAELLDWLAERQIPHREDESNRQAVTPRNALRLETLPQLEAAYPGASRHMAEAAENLALENDCLSAQAEMLYRECLLRGPGLFALRKEGLRRAHPALTGRALRRWILEGVELLGLDPKERGLSRADTLALQDVMQAEPGTAVNLPWGLKALCGAEMIHLLTQQGEPLTLLPVEPELPVMEQRRRYELPWAQLVLESAVAETPCSALWAVLPQQVLERGPVLRAPLAGDVIHPLGAPGSKPLRRYLTDRHIDLPLRPLLPVLAIGSQVLWIPQLCTSEMLRAGPACRLRLRLRGPIPFLPHHTKE